MLGSRFIKFLILILNWQVNSRSNFVSFFIVMIQNFPVNFKLIRFYFEKKDPIKVPIFRLSNMLWWKFAKLLISFLKAQVNFPSNVASIFSAIKQNCPILFLTQTVYTLFKRSPLKCTFLRFLSAGVKIRQIPHVNSSSNLASFFIVMTQNSPVNFQLISFLLWIKGLHQSPNF